MDIFAALAVPTRRTIVEMLGKNGEMSATDIARKFESSPPAISQHLKILRETRLVKMEKRGQQRVYTLDIEGLYELERWTAKMTNIWNERFDRLDALLQKQKAKK